MKFYLTLMVSLVVCNGIYAQKTYRSWRRMVYSQNETWYASDEARAVAENVLLYQRDIGGWPKNISMQDPLSDAEKEALMEKKPDPVDCTTDNHATITEMTFLSKIYQQQPNKLYKGAFIKGLKYLLEAQYDNGGWPQFYPTKEGYSRYITFNDNSMVNIMKLLDGLLHNEYAIVPDPELLKKTQIAYDKGIDCILKTQYVQNGVLTVWCAQHNEINLQPAKARSYELPSLSGQESAGIVLLLMQIENPSDAIKTSIKSAVSYFEKTKLTGIKIERYKTETGEREKRMVNDPSAPAVWGRFMELDNNTPFFCDRDGIKKTSIDQIGHERRCGYSWYSRAPQKVMDAYPAWKEKWDNAK